MNWVSFTTRKVLLGGAASLAVVAAWVASNWLPVAGQYYGTMVTGVCALYATFCGANTLQDHILKPKASEPAKPAAKPQPKPPAEPLPE